jgi:hypothetical protein
VANKQCHNVEQGQVQRRRAATVFEHLNDENMGKNIEFNEKSFSNKIYSLIFYLFLKV